MADDMHQNREVSINWLRVNIPQIVAILSVGMGLAWYGGNKLTSLEGRIEVVEQYRASRSAATDKNFDQIQQQLLPLSNLPYRVGVVEQGLLATNQRVDQYLQMLGAKIDGISDRVNGLSTKVEVLSQKIDAISPSKKAEISAPQVR
ncbi:hypothetical protein FJ422_29755 [Mesorhizobium sp. B2-6-3]|uniref:hypothetical protein n=1 Tax=Mesorhizobium sp. B2-6-3 TaxID=2589914 RepID=UPI001129391D|nr:hypothetical protein [Mesorhizobium sp. B2-6-3]TPJ76895.1 hypothetical protein FJ422_29755 [Mesorhizobium sp. B2-6-3]